MDDTNADGLIAFHADRDDLPLILAPEHQVSAQLVAFVRALDAELEGVRRCQRT